MHTKGLSQPTHRTYFSCALDSVKMASLSDSDEDFLLLDSLLPKLRKRRQGVHETNKERQIYGEYHHLFLNLKDNHPDRFFQYTRMTKETFDYILEKIEWRLVKTWCNWHRPILPEERLVVTLR